MSRLIHFPMAVYAISAENAIRHAECLIEARCGLVDIGGESTRPGSNQVSVRGDTPDHAGNRSTGGRKYAVSVDTSKPEVMRASIEPAPP